MTSATRTRTRVRRALTTFVVGALGAAVTWAPSAAATPARAVTGGWSGARAATCASTLDGALAALDRTELVAGAAAVAAGARPRAEIASTRTCLDAQRAAAPPVVDALLVAIARDAADVLAAPAGARRTGLRASASTRLRVLAATAAIASTRAGRTLDARAWLTLRERRPVTRVGVPDAPASAAIAAADRGEVTPARAAARVREDLLGTSLVVLRSRLDAVERRTGSGLLEGAVVDAAQAAAGWSLFAPVLRASDPSAASAADRAAAALGAAARATSPVAGDLSAAATRLDAAIAGFAPIASTSDRAAAENAARMHRFIQLVPVEYARGVHGSRVKLDLEVQEARSFLRGSLDAWTAVEPNVTARDANAAARLTQQLERLDDLTSTAELTPTDAATPDQVQRAADRVTRTIERTVPEEWLANSQAADLEVVRAAIKRVQSAAGRGDWTLAEQSRVEAYGIFEFGPELRLRAIDANLALTVEGLIWYGGDGTTGRATLVANRAAESAFAATTAKLTTRLDTVEKKLGTSATPGAIRTNSAIIVLREGMEAVLILAALTAGLQGAGRLRRPILVGGLLALVATAITFVIARALLDSLARFGEKLEVVVSLIAIGVLLLILNWFVHKAYWTGWMAGFQKKKVAIAGTSRERREAEAAIAGSDAQVDVEAASVAVELRSMQRASAIAQAGGLMVLGFTSIYREGFETVLFLQALVLDAGTLPVVEGTAIGLVGVSLLGWLTIRLQRRLPYKKMLIVTGVLIAVVLASMVGNTTQAMQATGWLPVHPVAGFEPPAWMTTWLGVHPTWEAVAGQFASVVFVVGSYVVAEWWTDRKRQRRRAHAAAHGIGFTASGEPLQPSVTAEPTSD
ncbi:MAG: iron permease, partial [Thermoleophilia bacterium]|nr:iron permease [Thermoleophilia bacterium]